MRTPLTTSLVAIACMLGVAACSGSPAEDETVAEPEAVVEEPAADATVEDVTAEEPATEEAAEETPAEEPVAEPEPEPVAKAVPPPPPAPEPVKVAAAMTEPPAIFKQRCAVCHTIEKGGADKLGPALYGTYGHPAAQGSFNFSTAFKEAGLTLDEPTLHAWLENPRKLVPGNRMSFPGLKNAEQRQEIIDYMKQQR